MFGFYIILAIVVLFIAFMGGVIGYLIGKEKEEALEAQYREKEQELEARKQELESQYEQIYQDSNFHKYSIVH